MSRWDERQRRLLQAMGVTVWQPAGASDDDGDHATEASPPSAAEVPPVQAEPVAAPAPMPAARPVSRAPAPAPVPAPRAPAGEREQAIAAMDWPALRASVADCRACGLCEGRTQTVFGVGHKQAHWMIVGEAPGEQEDRQGEPFVGPAGQLLDRMLAALDLTRGEASAERQVFIANTLKCRPPRNRNPEPAELALCRPYLERQIALVQPRIILAMGRFAVNMLLDSAEAIGRLRGQVHRYQGIPVIVTYHPAYLLRQPADKARSWADLCLAASVAEREGEGEARATSSPS